MILIKYLSENCKHYDLFHIWFVEALKVTANNELMSYYSCLYIKMLSSFESNPKTLIPKLLFTSLVLWQCTSCADSTPAEPANIFTTHIIAFASGPRSVYAADVDDDGDIDVLSASSGHSNFFRGEIAWYENDGNENFNAHTFSVDSSGFESVFATDMDDDGDMDLLSASIGDNRIAWYENDGNENFSTHNIASYELCPDCPAGARSVFAIDLDGDGDIDVLSASTDDDKIAWYENTGNCNYIIHHYITTDADYAYSVYAEDVDGDGDMDVLSASKNDHKIAWYENDGIENFATHVITTDADGANSVYAEDIDGDGDMDVLSASTDDNKIAWYENNGRENFTPHFITTSAVGAASVYAIDVDGDWDMDVLSAAFGDDEIAWYKNDGHENFTACSIAKSMSGARSVYALDVDGDGDMDVLSASTADDKIAWHENLTVNN